MAQKKALFSSLDPDTRAQVVQIMADNGASPSELLQEREEDTASYAAPPIGSGVPGSVNEQAAREQAFEQEREAAMASQAAQQEDVDAAPSGFDTPRFAQERRSRHRPARAMNPLSAREPIRPYQALTTRPQPYEGDIGSLALVTAADSVDPVAEMMGVR